MSAKGRVGSRDAIIELTSIAICGSELHIFDGVIPGMEQGDILGHEFMGRVVDTGPARTLKHGQRVVVPFTISWGAAASAPKGSTRPATIPTRWKSRTQARPPSAMRRAGSSATAT